MVEKLKTYYNETVAEMHKVTWPSKPEVIGSTIATVIVSLVAGF